MSLMLTAAYAEPPIHLKSGIVYKTTPEGDLCLDLYYRGTKKSKGGMIKSQRLLLCEVNRLNKFMNRTAYRRCWSPIRWFRRSTR
jgi:hypothetical protein